MKVIQEYQNILIEYENNSGIQKEVSNCYQRQIAWYTGKIKRSDDIPLYIRELVTEIHCCTTSNKDNLNQIT